MRRHGIAGRWLGWRASHGRDRAGPALVLEQPLAGGGAPTVPWLLVPCPFVAFPGGEPLGSPACCLGNAVELQRFVQRPSSEGTRGAFSFVSGLRVEVIHQRSGALWARAGNCILAAAARGRSVGER